ncbi:MAG: 3'-5' exonuclease [Draconibacterium sp.]|nr:3'-5' exonuclease [Draconibacterium sp.]
MKITKMFKENITKEELTDLPLKWFEGEIVVVDNVEKLVKAVKILSKAKVIGFDTETKPAFKKGVFNKVALLQLSVKKHAFLFRLNRIGLPAEICKILANPEIVKSGVAINDDIKALNKIKAFIPKGFIELQDHAKSLGITDFSLKKLAAITCGFRISKGQQLSNWEAEELTEAQQIYAATDAWAALEIFENFSKN